MTIRDIAGFCPEEAIWKMMSDISTFLLQEQTGCYLTPDAVVVDGYSFLVDMGQCAISEFLAPEQNDSNKPESYQMVWALGAVAYYMATGHVVFGGHGGKYQKEHPAVALPVLPKDFQSLTPVLQKCLYYNPNERTSLKELEQLSIDGLHLCEKQRRKQSASLEKEQVVEYKNIDERWPEKMIEK